MDMNTPRAAQPATATGPAARLFGRITQPVAYLSTTRANSVAGLLADVVVCIVLLAAGLRRQDSSLLPAMLALGCGLFFFSFVEYAFHRWLFHGRAGIMEQGHRKHHEQPLGHDSLPFFFAPLLLAGLAMLIARVVPTTLALLFCGGLAAGYATYGWSHVIIHNTRFRGALPRRWAALHHIHHRHPERNFGVTTPLWDALLRTRYAPGPRRPS